MSKVIFVFSLEHAISMMMLNGEVEKTNLLYMKMKREKMWGMVATTKLSISIYNLGQIYLARKEEE